MGQDEPPDVETPPDELIHYLRLALVSGVGPRIRQALLERFGSPEAVLLAAPSQLRAVPGVGPKLTGRIVAARDEIDVEAEIERCRRAGILILADSDPRYPKMLAEIHDPPGVLFVRGSLEPTDALAVAIVGTRRATRYGLRMAERLGGALAQAGLTIVSGLARGVDAAAHRGALAAGGRTLAVLGSGVMNIYPPEHVNLADEVAARGAVISEAPPLAAPMSGVFPQRNRIISGLSLGSIIVEAGTRSGALITARLAMEQGREVFAVPGQADCPAAHGCHQLIRDGVTLVASVDDVLEQLGPLFEPIHRPDGQQVRSPAELSLNEIEQQVLAAIEVDGTAIDQIVTATGLQTHRVLATLSVLEMRRLIRRVSGSIVARV